MKDGKIMMRKTIHGVLLAGAFALTGAMAVNAQVASQTYRTAGRDPFQKYKPPVKRVVVRKAVVPVALPDITLRVAQYKAKKLAAMNLQQPAPKPTTALLVGEIQVTGIFRTPRGYAAMVEATPIKLSYIIYPGEKFYDGMLVAIEETRLVFRRETQWTDGHHVVAVDTKQLRQADAVTDSMTEAKTAETAKATRDASDKEEKVSEKKP